jgi:hypothetical protein
LDFSVASRMVILSDFSRTRCSAISGYSEQLPRL